MKRNKKQIEAILDETLHNMSNEPLETRAIDEAASRVWSRIAADHNPASVMTPAAERINSCGDFQSLGRDACTHRASSPLRKSTTGRKL